MNVHLRSWTDDEGWLWTDVCPSSCLAGQDHWVDVPTHEVTWPSGPFGEQWHSRPCDCRIGRNHDARAWPSV